ncbi:Ig-like domain-containing protein [Pontibacter coccineus]|uniref:Ig-like domain-containing protein n=1 Tax=Pontibacter coccineus TaxID=3063328 RepID=UPI0026E17E41|nr:Ig-like domain-containing protein [Pontibacter sp. BT731]
MNLRKLVTSLAFASVVVIAGCKEDTFIEDFGVCPVVLSTTPLDGAIEVPRESQVTVTFNEAMNPATINQTSFTLLGPDKAEGAITYNTENHTLTFVPKSKLKYSTTYTGRVATSVKDMLGNALQKEYVWTFSTGDLVSPVVISTDPVNNATGILLNKAIAASFSVPMDPSTINTTTYTLKQGATAIAGVVTYSGTTAVFTPTGNLTENTVYTGTITTGALNKEGNPLLSHHVWSFTTVAHTTPTITSTDPAHQATGVALNKVINATFSEMMNPATITATSFTLKTGTTTVVGTTSYTGTKASFTPTNNLAANTTYTVTITTAAKSTNDVALAKNHEWSFTTAAENQQPGTPTVGVNLKTAARFGIFAGVGISNNAGPSVIRDLDVGITPGVRSSVTGFPPAIVENGAIYASDDITPPGTAAMLLQAKKDLLEAYLFAEGASAPAPATVAGDQGGKTLAPGIYKSTSTLLVQAGNLTLDAKGDPNAVWIFQIASDFTTVGGAGGNIILTGGAQAKNIFWQIGSSATIGDGTSFKGNVLAYTSITMNSGARAVGRMLALNGAVVMTNTNIIEKP